MTWVICVSEIFSEFSGMKPENHIEILRMSVAQNAYMLNKKIKNWKLARSKTEVAFLLKEGVTCIWCPSDLFKFSKKDLFLKKEFALSMACKLSKSLLMQKVYIFKQDKLSDVLIENILIFIQVARLNEHQTWRYILINQVQFLTLVYQHSLML